MPQSTSRMTCRRCELVWQAARCQSRLSLMGKARCRPAYKHTVIIATPETQGDVQSHVCGSGDGRGARGHAPPPSHMCEYMAPLGFGREEMGRGDMHNGRGDHAARGTRVPRARGAMHMEHTGSRTDAHKHTCAQQHNTHKHIHTYGRHKHMTNRITSRIEAQTSCTQPHTNIYTDTRATMTHIAQGARSEPTAVVWDETACGDSLPKRAKKASISRLVGIIGTGDATTVLEIPKLFERWTNIFDPTPYHAITSHPTPHPDPTTTSVQAIPTPPPDPHPITHHPIPPNPTSRPPHPGCNRAQQSVKLLKP
jgi:hypothetical protein